MRSNLLYKTTKNVASKYLIICNFANHWYTEDYSPSLERSDNKLIDITKFNVVVKGFGSFVEP